MIEDETVWLDFVHEASGGSFSFQPSVGLYSSLSRLRIKTKEKRPQDAIFSNRRLIEKVQKESKRIRGSLSSSTEG